MVADGGRVRFARLVYSVCYVWGYSALSGLQNRGVSVILRFLMYTSELIWNLS